MSKEKHKKKHAALKRMSPEEFRMRWGSREQDSIGHDIEESKKAEGINIWTGKSVTGTGDTSRKNKETKMTGKKTESTADESNWMWVTIRLADFQPFWDEVERTMKEDPGKVVMSTIIGRGICSYSADYFDTRLKRNPGAETMEFTKDITDALRKNVWRCEKEFSERERLAMGAVDTRPVLPRGAS